MMEMIQAHADDAGNEEEMTRIMTLILFTRQPVFSQFYLHRKCTRTTFRNPTSPDFIFDANARSI